MRVGVIIVNWNSGRFLIDCVHSVLRQTRRADRVLLIDNDSSDGSLGQVLSLQSEGLEVIKAGSNLGFAAANNLAMQQLEDCDWVALLNPDAVAADTWIESLLQAVSRYPDAGSMACRMMSMDDKAVLDGAGDCYHVSGLVWRRYHGKELTQLTTLNEAPVFGACAGAALYHRKTFIDTGGFDESFFCYCEDVDLAFRMQLQGKPCWYIHDAVVSHKGGGTTGESTEFADYHGHRNLVWTWFKNMPLPLLLLLLPAHLLANLLMLAVSVSQGRGSVIMRAKIDALKGISAPLSRRAAVQSGRRISLWRLWQVMEKSLWRK